MYLRRCSVSDPLLLIFVDSNDLGHPRIGLSVSRKVGGAVLRNRWKRSAARGLSAFAEPTARGHRYHCHSTPHGRARVGSTPRITGAAGSPGGEETRQGIGWTFCHAGSRPADGGPIIHPSDAARWRLLFIATGLLQLSPAMSFLWSAIRGLPAWLLVGTVRLYQIVLSPWLGRNCRYHPTCSTYMIEAVGKYGCCAAVGGGSAASPAVTRCMQADTTRRSPQKPGRSCRSRADLGGPTGRRINALDAARAANYCSALVKSFSGKLVRTFPADGTSGIAARMYERADVAGMN